MSTLANIKDKVRKLTKNYSVTQLSDANLLSYINDFYLYDFPQIVETSDLRKNISFSTTPYVDTYSTTAGDFIYNLKDFKDFVIVTDQPVYLSGTQIQLFQDPAEFYQVYSSTKRQGTFGTGDGATTNFTGTLPPYILHNSVLIGGLNANGEALIAKDSPNVDAYGREASTGVMRDNDNDNIGNINYVTGAVDITFDVAPGNGNVVTYEYYQFNPTTPDGILLFDNKLTLRPVPDKVYEVKLQVRIQPTAFVNDADTPLIKQWWQFIAYGTAKKILEDRSDLETVNRIMPEYDRQKIMVMRKTRLNKSKDRTSTIFTHSQNVTDTWYYYG